MASFAMAFQNDQKRKEKCEINLAANRKQREGERERASTLRIFPSVDIIIRLTNMRSCVCSFLFIHSTWYHLHGWTLKINKKTDNALSADVNEQNRQAALKYFTNLFFLLVVRISHFMVCDIERCDECFSWDKKYFRFGVGNRITNESFSGIVSWKWCGHKSREREKKGFTIMKIVKYLWR